MSNNFIKNSLTGKINENLKFSNFFDEEDQSVLTNKAVSLILNNKQNEKLKNENFKSQYQKNDDNNSFQSLSMKSAWKIKKNENQQKSVFQTEKKKPVFQNFQKSNNPEENGRKERNLKDISENEEITTLIKEDLENLANFKNDFKKCVTFEKKDILINCIKFTKDIKDCFRLLDDYPDLFFSELKVFLLKLFPSEFVSIQKINLNIQKYSLDKKISKVNELNYEMSEKMELEGKQNIKKNKTNKSIRIYFWDTDSEKDMVNTPINQFLKTEGYITYVSPVKGLVESMKFKCTQCGLNTQKKFDNFVFQYPDKCSSCLNYQFFPLKTTSKMILIQRLRMVNNERDGKNQSVILELRGNLINSLDVGDEVEVAGILRSEILNKDDFLGKQQNKEGGLYMVFVEINSVIKKNEKIFKTLKNNTDFDFISKSNILTSQIYLESDKNDFEKQNKNAIYFLKLSSEESKLFNQIYQDDIVFETLITFFCPKIQSRDSYLIKAFLVLSLILQDDPLNLLIFGNAGGFKNDLFKFAEDVAHKTFPNTDIKWFPSMEKMSGFDKGINPGLFVLANEGVSIVENITKMKKNDFVKMFELIKNQKVNLPKMNNDKNFLEVKTSILAGVDCNEEMNDNYQQVKHNLNLPKYLIDAFDFTLLIKKPKKKYVKNLVMNLFEGVQAMSQYKPNNNNEIQTEGFTEYLLNVIKSKNIYNRFALLENINIYQKFQKFVQNTSKPRITPEISKYLKDYYFSLKKMFELRNNEIDLNFFTSLIKLIMARTIMNNTTTITHQICDEIIEMINELFHTLYPTGGKKNCQLSQGNKKLSKKKKEQLFLEALQKLALEIDDELCDFQTLKELEENLGLEMENFKEFVEKLNYNGVLILKNSKQFQIMKIW